MAKSLNESNPFEGFRHYGDADRSASSLQSRLTSLLEGRFNKNLSEMARVIGVRESTLRGWIKGGRRPMPDAIQNMAKKLNVEIEWLMTGEKTAPKSPEKLDSGIRLTETSGDQVRIPLVNVYGEAGNGFEFHSEDVVEYLSFPRRFFVNNLEVNPDNIQAITVMGDSMVPKLDHGNIVFLDVSNIHPSDGIYVVSIDGAVLIKKMQILSGKSIKLSSFNPEYEPIVVNPDPPDSDFKILGRVIWGGSRL